MIDFRCWYCNKRYVKKPELVGTQFPCSCKQTLRVPKRSNGRCRVKKPLDYLMEAVVYGGGCALAGFLLGLFLVGRAPLRRGEASFVIIGGLTLTGLLLGTFGGERAVNYFGGMLRERES